ncbi:Uncharacterised protein [Mycobacterium tuberculosis]|nr:Uncharacterised protein [Mycobacterium tuberculosis]
MADAFDLREKLNAQTGDGILYDALDIQVLNDLLYVLNKHTVRRENKDLLRAELLRILVQQIRDPVQSDARFAASSYALDQDRRGDAETNHFVLLALDRGDDIAHLMVFPAIEPKLHEAVVVQGWRSQIVRLCLIAQDVL